MSFYSDNTVGLAPEILAALAEADRGSAMPYGEDAVSARLTAHFAEVFETDVAMFPVAVGTAANALALAATTPPWGAVLCHRDSHINEHECGAPEFYTGGAKLVALDGEHAKLTPAAVTEALADAGPGAEHRVVPAALALTQATEAGTVYQVDEVRALSAVAREHGLTVHVDGARFANAVVATGASPADLTWRSGVDTVAFGATKNGAMAAEAIVVFDPERAATIGYRRKRGGHLFSKMRYLSAQLLAYLEDDLWLRLAGHANAMTRRLEKGLRPVPEVAIDHPVEANMIWLRWPRTTVERLAQAGIGLHSWPIDEHLVGSRLVTAWNTRPEDVDSLIAAARG